MSYQVVHQLQQKAVPVQQCCRVLGVSRSGYYAALKRPTPAAACSVTPHLKAVFASSGRSYGSRRMVTAMKEQGYTLGRYKLRKLMKLHQLVPTWKRKFVHTTDSKHNLPVASNVLARQFEPQAPNQAWVADITYVRTRAGWLYLAVVLELYSRKVIGWAMAPSMPAELVCTALSLAIQQRQPAAGLIVHSDRGSQYASSAYQELLKRHGLVCSMSRKGNCWDNAVMERFFLNLKMERVWQRDYANHAEAKRDVTDYIVGFYNNCRLHSKLGNLPPVVYERQMAAKHSIEVSENT